MCTCASCSYTDSFLGYGVDAAKGGFANWPRGNPAGARGSAADYAAHWRHCSAMSEPIKLGGPWPQRFPYHGIGRIQPNAWQSAGMLEGNGRAPPKRPRLALSRPPRRPSTCPSWIGSASRLE